MAAASRADGGRYRGLMSRPVQVAYVGAVAALAAVGFALGSPVPVVAAALLTLPASLLLVPAYYVAYGLLALVPGANPSSSSGSGSGAGGGSAVTQVVTGEPAAWFTVTTSVLGVVMLVAAAVANVVVLQRLSARRRSASRLA